ncbi:MAG: cupin domain-containing protein [Bdellovibrionales bacterium]|nr:cupin domain-containing protein [Bdellovibrionales bacterium]
MKLLIYISIICNLTMAASQSYGGEGMASAEDIIKAMDLKPLPEEGGYYRETYRSDYGTNPARLFGINADSDRNVSTAIYYLISKGSFSAIHRIKSDEIFHFYAGDPIEMLQIDEQGNKKIIIMGNDVLNGQEPQIVVPRNHWQALRLVEGGSWALMGTTVAPGFEFEDFEVGMREQMLELFPQHREDIIRFTRESHEKAH